MTSYIFCGCLALSRGHHRADGARRAARSSISLQFMVRDGSAGALGSALMPFGFRQKKTKTIDLHVLLTRQDAEELKRQADARDLTVSAVARFHLRKSLWSTADQPDSAT